MTHGLLFSKRSEESLCYWQVMHFSSCSVKFKMETPRNFMVNGRFWQHTGHNLFSMALAALADLLTVAAGMRPDRPQRPLVHAQLSDWCRAGCCR